MTALRTIAAQLWADRRNGVIILAAFPFTYAAALAACALIKGFL